MAPAGVWFAVPVRMTGGSGVKRSLFVVLVTTVVLGVVAGPAWAGSPGVWQKIGTDVGSSLPAPSAARTGDGYLHAVWSAQAGAKAAYAHVRISPSGTVGSVAKIFTWGTLTWDPKILRNGAGLQVLFSGLYNTDPTHPLSKGAFYRTTAGKGGGSWSAPARVGKWTYAYANYGTGATLEGDGTPVVGGVLNSDSYWHVGTSAADADGQFTISSGSLLDLSLATDAATGAVWASWYDLNKGGIWVRRIEPTLSAPQQAPGSVTKGSSITPDQAVAMVAPKGGGVYVAYCVGYPSCTSARLWKVGTSSTLTIPGTKYVRTLDLSVGPAGRIWAAWMSNTDDHVYAVRSNTKVSKFGAVRDLGQPQGGYVYKLDIEGSLGRGDVLVNAGSSGGINNIWHTQVLPGLTLTASPLKWNGGSAKTVTFTVRDAGAGLNGATVKVGTKSCKTGSTGTCKIAFGKLSPRKLTATATKAGYAKDALKLAVT